MDAYEYHCKTQTNRLSWASERAGGLHTPDADISSRMSVPTWQISSYSRGWVTTTSSRKPASQQRRCLRGGGSLARIIVQGDQEAWSGDPQEPEPNRLEDGCCPGPAPGRAGALGAGRSPCA